MVLRHATRNALLPVVTSSACSSARCCPGAVLTETVFNLAGVGRTLFEAITGRDYVVIQGFTLVIAVVYVIVNLARRHLLRLPRPADPAAMSATTEPLGRRRLAGRTPRAGIRPRRDRRRPSRRACGATRSATSSASARRSSG